MSTDQDAPIGVRADMATGEVDTVSYLALDPVFTATRVRESRPIGWMDPDCGMDRRTEKENAMTDSRVAG